MDHTANSGCSSTPASYDRLKRVAGAALVLLVSLVLNDPRQPAPLAVSALVVTALILGKVAVCGVRWLMRESDVHFPQRSVPPRAMVAKLVPWIGFGAALPAALIVTLLMLIGHRPPQMMGYVLHLLLLSLVPTVAACLALTPFARNQSEVDGLATERDRGVFPIAIGLMIYVVGAFALGHIPPHGFSLWLLIKHLVGTMVGAFLPTHWPQHVIAVAVSCEVLRLWFGCTACVAPGADAGGGADGTAS